MVGPVRRRAVELTSMRAGSSIVILGTNGRPWLSGKQSLARKHLKRCCLETEKARQCCALGKMVGYSQGRAYHWSFLTDVCWKSRHSTGNESLLPFQIALRTLIRLSHLIFESCSLHTILLLHCTLVLLCQDQPFLDAQSDFVFTILGFLLLLLLLQHGSTCHNFPWSLDTSRLSPRLSAHPAKD